MLHNVIIFLWNPFIIFKFCIEYDTVSSTFLLQAMMRNIFNEAHILYARQ